MPLLKVLPLDYDIQTYPEETLREALIRCGIHIESPCGGQGICGKCGVWIEDPADIAETPHHEISKDQAQRGLRLSCQIMADRDMVISLPKDFIQDSKKFRQSQSILEGERLSWSRIASAVKIIQSKGSWWLEYDRKAGPVKLDIWESFYSPKGLAIDLGTTTIVVTLVDLLTGEELATASSLNPQIPYGHDVISRILYGSTAQGLTELSSCVRKGLNQLLMEVCQDTSSRPEEILDVTIGGNTTMLQLAAQIDPGPLGKIPFSVGMKGGVSYPVKSFGLAANPCARVYIPPILHAFIGTDVSAGMLMSGSFFEDSFAMLFMDVGTNGELGLNLMGKRLVTSTAAGPAFEGSRLHSGMRASIGAVDHVSTDGSEIYLSTIGHAPIKGICGSGIVDLIAALLQTGLLDISGRLKRPYEARNYSAQAFSRLEEIEGQPAYRLAENVYFTQQDVRQVQLSKSAIRTAMDLLLKAADSGANFLQEIIIAGGFGFSLNPHNLERIGLIPPRTGDKVKFAGNASRSGCVWLLLDISYRRFLEERMQKIKHLSLGDHPLFMQYFVDNMGFPK